MTQWSKHWHFIRLYNLFVIRWNSFRRLCFSRWFIPATVKRNEDEKRKKEYSHNKGFQIKSYKPVSRILFPIAIGRLSFICPGSYLSGSICLPWILNEQFSKRSYMWHFSMQGLPSIDVTINSRRLLPYVFTFTRRQLFSVALSVPAWGETRLFTGALLCAVRTFLPNVKSDR